MRSFKTRGHFWLPESPDREIAGIASFSPTEGGKLELFGKLGEDTDLSFKKHRLILGRVERSKLLTLEDCFTTHITSSGPDDFASYRFHGSFEGIHVSDRTELAFDQIQIGITHLYEWFNNSSMKPTGSPSSGTLGVDLSIMPHVNVNFDGIEMELRQGPTVRYGRPHSTLGEEAAFLIKLPTEADVETLIDDYALPLKYLVSLATGEPDTFTSIHLLRSKYPYNPVVLSYAQSSFREPKDMAHHDMIFDCSLIGTELERKLELWMRAHREIGVVMKLFSRENSAPDLFGELKLTTIAQALESYDRIRNDLNNKTVFETRVKRLLVTRSKLFKPLVGDLDKFARVVVDCRNYFTHYGDRQPKVKSMDGTNILLITRCMATLLQSCLLSEIEIPIEEQVRMFSTSKVYYILKHHAGSVKGMVATY